MLFLGLSVPGEVPRCSASVLVLLAGFLNSDLNSRGYKVLTGHNWSKRKIDVIASHK